MDELGRSRAESFEEPSVQRLVRAVVVATHDVGDAEVDVVDDRREVIRRRPVLAQQREPVEPVAERRPSSRCRSARSLCRTGPSSQAIPSHSRSSRIASSPPGTLRARVGVVDPQQHPVAEPPIRDGAQRVAEMERARGARREADSRHRPSVRFCRDGVLARNGSPPKRLICRFPAQRLREAAGRDAIPPRQPEVYVAMPMPHRTQQQLIKRRLVGKEGAERIRELRAILAELPATATARTATCANGSKERSTAARTRKRVVHRDSIAVRREGAAQIALVGPPNAGKSSLLQALSAIQIRTGDYAFTTTRPVAATTRLGGVLVQLVEIPGLIEGAAEDRGGGRALLGVLRNADAILWCHGCDRPAQELETIRSEVASAGIELPELLAATKCDEAPTPTHPELRVVPVSVLDDESLDRLREELWGLTGLIRVYLRDGGDPIALRASSDGAGRGRRNPPRARTSAPPAPASGGRRRASRASTSGRQHELEDGDTVEVLER